MILFDIISMVILGNTPYTNDDKIKQYLDLYPFELSNFQKYSIDGIINNQHILVTAHTGSGKTLPAEFTIEYFSKISVKKK